MTIGALMVETGGGGACVRCGEQITFDERGWFELESKALRLASLRQLADESVECERGWHVRCVDEPLRPRGGYPAAPA
jgi:hypothetical protein